MKYGIFPSENIFKYDYLKENVVPVAFLHIHSLHLYIMVM